MLRGVVMEGTTQWDIVQNMAFTVCYVVISKRSSTLSFYRYDVDRSYAVRFVILMGGDIILMLLNIFHFCMFAVYKNLLFIL